jgi:hypothetical protein
MASKIGNAAADEARGVAEFDLLASRVDREINSASESAQAASVVTDCGPAAAKGRPRFTRSGFAYTPAKNGIDNCLKSAMGSISRIVVADDSPIVKVTVEKKFGVDPKLVLLNAPNDAGASKREASR